MTIRITIYCSSKNALNIKTYLKTTECMDIDLNEPEGCVTCFSNNVVSALSVGNKLRSKFPNTVIHYASDYI